MGGRARTRDREPLRVGERRRGMRTRMLRAVLVVVALAAVTACGGDTTAPTATPTASESTDMTDDGDPTSDPASDPAADDRVDPALRRQIDRAAADLATRLDVEPAAIEVTAAETVVWPDSSLGCPRPGMSYLQVLTDGFRITLAHDGTVYRYHGGGKRAEPFLCE